MNYGKKILCCIAALAWASFGASKDFFFGSGEGAYCMAPQTSKATEKFKDDQGRSTPCQKLSLLNSPARIRVMDAPLMKSAPYGIYLERPFFVLDGIHLDPEETRSLSDFEQDARDFGLPDMLTAMGYTPVLVQFAETVDRSLEENAQHFSEILKFLNGNSQIPFPEAGKEGFVVMGISQGGVIGRYGSYLYDSKRKLDDAPIRLFASLDSPHQGAVMPRSLFYTIDFWAKITGNASAEAFKDMLRGPGASDLILYDTVKVKKEGKAKVEYLPKTDSARFLFGAYRKAAEYKGFPTVLIAQGQMKGVSPSHPDSYFKLDRSAKLLGALLGRAQSSMSAPKDTTKRIAFNRVYDTGSDDESSVTGDASFDFVQGSTYPFAETIYKALRKGMLEAIPDRMKVLGAHLDVAWSADTLYQGSSAFIPTASAMDLKCDGSLGIKKNCAFSETWEKIQFENPGKRSTASAVYVVDPTHPRYGEAISGRHVDNPVQEGKVNKTVLAGMQVDIWRVLCQVAKNDYDSASHSYRNPKLLGIFDPSGSCMDQSKIPTLITKAGSEIGRKYGYARYDYASSATEKMDEVSFTLPAGWQKVATYDAGTDIPDGAIFEIEVKLEKPKANWLKTELLVTQDKAGRGQVQLTEQTVKPDGLSHVVRWQMPSAKGAMAGYRWFRLVLNSNGGVATVSKPRLVMPSVYSEENIPKIPREEIYPDGWYDRMWKTWNDHVSVVDYLDSGSVGLNIVFTKADGVLFFDLGKQYNVGSYKNLHLSYVPGTCQNVNVSGDTENGLYSASLKDGQLVDKLAHKRIPLKNLVNPRFNTDNKILVSRFTLKTAQSGEKCYIKSVTLE